MTPLTEEKCVACHGDSPPISEDEIRELSPYIAQWTLMEEDGIPKLVRTFRFPDFKRALDFTGAVGELAHSEGHHPRIVTEWGRVSVTWWTHKIRNLHRNDFIMAAKTEQLYQR